jgi:hypothetical protein
VASGTDTSTYLGPVILEDHEAGLRVSHDRGLQTGPLSYTVPRAPGSQSAQPVHLLHEAGWAGPAARGLQYEDMPVGGFLHFCLQSASSGL